ncbi:MAG TPA: metallophosphoesterase [Bacteroidales bacterium]|nr:metallophosphoesterase [Bacteroidales bacterium]
MKRRSMALFFIIVFSVYFLVNLYLFIKGYRAVSYFHGNHAIYITTFIILALSFIIGKVTERTHPSVFSDVLNIIGSFWLAFMLYGFLLFFISDIIYLIFRFSGILPVEKVPEFKKWAYISTIVVSLSLIVVGFINALIPVTRHYEINISKAACGIKNLRIAAVSDIHLGSIIRKRSIVKLSRMLSDVKPDVIFLLGDIVDGEIGPVMRNDLLKYFNCPKCRDGLLAITGNHEFIGGASVTIPYIEKNGIRILKDEAVVIDGCIQVIGRLDRDGLRYRNEGRKPLSKLMEQVDSSKPVILLDHQPFNLDEAEKAGVDLQLSGHTHNGQMWPLNYITKKIYEVSSGYKKKGNTHIIVSSGFGIWGPRVRLGSRPEIIVVDITFSGN